MKRRRLETVAVYADLDHFDEPAAMGSLHCRTGGFGDIFTFAYEEN